MINNDLQTAQKATPTFHVYLQELRSEREQLLNNVFPDLVATTSRLAQIDSELTAGKKVYLAAMARTRELQERLAFDERKVARKASNAK